MIFFRVSEYVGSRELKSRIGPLDLLASVTVKPLRLGDPSTLELES